MQRRVSHEGVFALIALLSLVYMRYYEKTLYYKPINQFFDIVYQYISIPFFYFFTASFITILLIYLLKINLSERILKMLNYPIIIAFILYAIFIFLNIIGILSIHFIFLKPMYLILFAALGILFAFTKR
ncbi:hypothetical protein J2Z80_001885 [Thermoanaerobacterium butyriciformans]|uniref:Uncharacterized protein n=1 Tax=Thermoanaerobacterium butyriciformans TaxID=1702242 RepID=A0ABS4NFB6_9THEO|nr:hypothetical protein [Thermoanaerobacterium butyriciformans]